MKFNPCKIGLNIQKLRKLEFWYFMSFSSFLLLSSIRDKKYMSNFTQIKFTWGEIQPTGRDSFASHLSMSLVSQRSVHVLGVPAVRVQRGPNKTKTIFSSTSHVLNYVAVVKILYVLPATNYHNFRWLIKQLFIHREYHIFWRSGLLWLAVTPAWGTLWIHRVVQWTWSDVTLAAGHRISFTFFSRIWNVEC